MPKKKPSKKRKPSVKSASKKKPVKKAVSKKKTAKKKKPENPKKEEKKVVSKYIKVNKADWKLTGGVLGKLATAFSIGATIGEASYYANIDPDTYYRWVKKYPILSEYFERLKNKPILKARQSVVSSLDNPDMALKYLERKLRGEFGRRVEVEDVVEREKIEEERKKLKRFLEDAKHDGKQDGEIPPTADIPAEEEGSTGSSQSDNS
jgi:hypothetical protein